MKLGLDIHGVINVNASFFSAFSKLALEREHEVHIITGSMLTPRKIEEIKRYGVVWTNIFSISDYHRHLGTTMTFSDPNNPWIDHTLWDKTKAVYCEDFNIDFHIDDTLRYGEYFKTPFALYDHENKRLDWHLGGQKHGALPLTNPEEILNIIEKISSDIKRA